MLTRVSPCENYPTGTSEGSWTVVESGGDGGSVLVADGSLSGNGSHYINFDGLNSSKVAYIRQTVDAVAAGEWFACGMYVQKPYYDMAGDDFYTFFNFCNVITIYAYYPHVDNIRIFDDAGTVLDSLNLPVDHLPYHFACAFKKSSGDGVADGEVYVYVDGVEKYHYTGRVIWTRPTTDIRIGVQSTRVGQYYVDDIKLGNRLEDVLPGGTTPPAVTGELPSAERTVILFNQNNADSRTFAESIAADESLLCPLPCETDETLATYQEFYDQVEFPLKNFLAFQPDVAAQITCIVAGLNVPGYFYDSGHTISTSNRLMNVDNELSYALDNPFYGTSERLTATALQAAGMRLAARVDAASLEMAQYFQGLGDTINVITEGSKIFTTREPSLDEQFLRLPIELLEAGDVITGDALTFKEASPPSYTVLNEAPGQRTSNILYTTNLIPRTTIMSNPVCWNYRSLIVFVNAFDFAAFCRMLLAGGTIAEAFAVAAQKLDTQTMLAGWPLLSATFPASGYNIYANGELAAATPAGVNTIEISQSAGTVKYEVSAVSSRGVESAKTSPLRAVVADDGSVIGSRPNVPAELICERAAGGYITLKAMYDNSGQSVAATGIEFALCDAQGKADFSVPDATAGLGLYGWAAATLGPYAHGTTLRFRARAVAADGTPSIETPAVVVVADAQAPAPIETLVAETYDE